MIRPIKSIRRGRHLRRRQADRHLPKDAPREVYRYQCDGGRYYFAHIRPRPTDPCVHYIRSDAVQDIAWRMAEQMFEQGPKISGADRCLEVEDE